MSRKTEKSSNADSAGKKNSEKLKKEQEATRQAHDLYFKAAFSDLDVSRTVLKKRLPQSLVSLCDWDTLKLESTHAQTGLLRESIADAIFSIKLQDRGDLKVLYHLEHLSSPKRWISLYCWNVIFNYLSQKMNKEKVKKLPLMVPLIVYQNTKTFPHSTDICDLFEFPELAREHLFKPIRLFDICHTDHQELMTYDKAGVSQLTMKYIFDPNFEAVFAEHIAPVMVAVNKGDVQGARRLLKQTIMYISRKANLPNKEKFVKMVGEIDQDLEEKMTTIVQQSWYEGRQEGEKQGRQQGRQEIVATMLRNGASPETIAALTNMPVDKVRSLIGQFEAA